MSQLGGKKESPLGSKPKLACCNFFSENKYLKEFAMDHAFHGVDWSFNSENLPRTRKEEIDLVETISNLYPLEVRYHCFFLNTDLGAVDSREANRSYETVSRHMSFDLKGARQDRHNSRELGEGFHN